MDDPFEPLREAIAANQRRTDEVAEGLQGLRGEVTELRGEVTELRGEVRELRGEVRELRGEVRELRGEVRELRGEVRELRGEVREHRHHTDEVARDLRAYTDEKFEENRRYFLVLAEELRSDLRLVVEGFVTMSDDLQAVRREMSQGFGEIKSLFRVAFADHERRIRALEQR